MWWFLSFNIYRESEFPDLESAFKPSLINSTIYIISMGMQVSTFAINYKVSGVYTDKSIIFPWTVCESLLCVIIISIIIHHHHRCHHHHQHHYHHHPSSSSSSSSLSLFSVHPSKCHPIFSNNFHKCPTPPFFLTISILKRPPVILMEVILGHLHILHFLWWVTKILLPF